MGCHQRRRRPQEMLPKARKFSRTCAVSATLFPHIQLVQLSVVLEDPISLLVKVSVTLLLFHQRLPSNGLPLTWIDGLSPQLILLQETPWLSLVSHQLKTEPILSHTSWAEIRRSLFI